MWRPVGLRLLARWVPRCIGLASAAPYPGNRVSLLRSCGFPACETLTLGPFCVDHEQLPQRGGNNPMAVSTIPALVASGNSLRAMLLQATLGDCGFDVRVAVGLRAALDLIRRQTFRLYVVDCENDWSGRAALLQQLRLRRAHVLEVSAPTDEVEAAMTKQGSSCVPGEAVRRGSSDDRAGGSGGGLRDQGRS